MLAVKNIYGNTKIYRLPKDTIPQVSILMPTFGCAKTTLKRSIDSILEQSFTDFELIVIDDGSRDGTFALLLALQKKDPRIVIVKRELNSGLPALCINQAIPIAMGTYISYQFDNEIYLKDALQHLYDNICQKDEPCLVYGTSIMDIKVSKRRTKRRILKGPFDYNRLSNRNCIANNSVMHHKTLFKDYGLFDPHVVIRPFADYDFWLRLAKKVPFYWVDHDVSHVYSSQFISFDSRKDFRFSQIRKYLEIDRVHLLNFDSIQAYEVDDLEYCKDYFSGQEIDILNRQQIFPYRCKTPYYIDDFHLARASLSRPKVKSFAVSKGYFSTSFDVAVKNFTHRIKGFPFHSWFLTEQHLPILEHQDFDILCLYRTIGQSATEVIKRVKKLNKPVAYIMDDNMFAFHKLSQDYSHLSPGTTDYSNLEYQVNNADMILTFSPHITENCKTYNSHILELDTNIPSSYVDACKLAPDTGRIRYAVFSNPASKDIFNTLWPSIQKFTKKYKRKVEFYFFGIDPTEFGKIHCPYFYEPDTNSYDRYMDQLKTKYFHYHLSPQEDGYDTLFSQMPVKFLEGTVAGAVGIFSNVKPYDDIPNDYCIKTDNHPKSWYEALCHTIKTPLEIRQSMYENARLHIYNSWVTERFVHNFTCGLETTELHAYMKNRAIAYFLHESYLSGASLHLIEHAHIMQELGFKILLVLPRSHSAIKDLNERAEKYNMPVHYLNYKCYSHAEIVTDKHKALAQPILKWLQEKEVGLAHSITYSINVGLACKEANIPHIATLHTYHPHNYLTEDIRKEPVINMIHSSAICYAQQWKQQLNVPSKKIACPVNHGYFNYYRNNLKNVYGYKMSTIRVLISGTLTERKNQLAAMKAIYLLRQLNYNIHLDVIGYDTLQKPYADRCKSYIRQNDLDYIIDIHGFTTPQSYYQNYCHILLNCSTEDSMPQTILQAMASGLLVVSTNVGGVAEIIKDRYTGILTSGFHEESIAEALQRAITLSAEEKEFILRNAHKTCQMIAKPEFVRSELVDLYNQAIENKKRK